MLIFVSTSRTQLKTDREHGEDQGRIHRGRLGRSPLLKRTKVSFFTMIRYNSENSITYIRLFCHPVFCHSSVVTSGVFKGRRARHLSRAPLFGGSPLRYYAHKFSLFLVKDVLFTHVMCYKANHKQVFRFQRPPYRNCNVQVPCLKRGPNSN